MRPRLTGSPRRGRVPPSGGGAFNPPNILSSTGHSGGFTPAFALAPDTTDPARFGDIDPDNTKYPGEWVAIQNWTLTEGPTTSNQAGVITSPGSGFTPVKNIFACWRWEANSGFDHTADIQKYVRFMDGDWGTLILTLDQMWGDFPLLWDLWGGGGGQNQNPPALLPNAMRNQTHWYEVQLDMTVAGTATARLWIDDVLKNERSVSVNHSAIAIGSVQWYYTYNGPASDSLSWIAYPALSTERIGMNWHQ